MMETCAVCQGYDGRAWRWPNPFIYFQLWEWLVVYLDSLSVPACMLRLDWNCYMQIQYIVFIWRTQFGVTFKCIAMLSIKISSLFECYSEFFCDLKQCFSQYLISQSSFGEWAYVLTDLRFWYKFWFVSLCIVQRC